MERAIEGGNKRHGGKRGGQKRKTKHLKREQREEKKRIHMQLRRRGGRDDRAREQMENKNKILVRQITESKTAEGEQQGEGVL